jgi:uncharacterized membrane protein
MDLSSPLPRRLRALIALALAALAVCAPAAAGATTSPSAATKAPVLLARAGSGTSSFSRGRSGYGFGSHRSYRGYGYRRTGGGSFLHGLFVGWTLGHFFGYGGGIPLFPLLFFLFIFWVMIRGPRRPPPRRRGPWMLR